MIISTTVFWLTYMVTVNRRLIRLLIRSEDALTEILDMDPSIADDPQFAEFISGNHVLDGSSPVAHRYGGYQFGYWVSIIDLQGIGFSWPVIWSKPGVYSNPLFHFRRASWATAAPTSSAST